MTSSGTEATMTALRIARAATGRESILKFAGAYHGHVDGLLVQAGSGLPTQGIPASPGVPAAVTAQSVVVPWNDPDALVEAVRRQAPAAILAEPIPANMGLVPARAGFLELLREQADASGALLVLDEVISGFRVARGGAQELTEVHGDLVLMGKVLGGGLPAAAVGGRAELLGLLAPAGEVYQAGTLSGNPLAVAAGIATLRLLDEAAYMRLGSITEQLATGLREAAGERPVQVVSRPGAPHRSSSSASAPCRVCRMRRRATWRPTPPGAGACSRAGSTRRPRSSRPGFHRWLTPPSTSSAPSRRPRRRSRSWCERRSAAARSTARRAGGGLLASLLESETQDGIPANGSSPARLATSGPRASAHAAEYELLLEAIYEGYLLHYGTPRLLHPPEADLGLLAGDQLYAMGLARLLALGDLPAVAELADVITLTALAHGAAHEELAQALWSAGARAVGWGSSEPHRQAKALARAGEPGALEAMRAAAQLDRH